MLPSEGHLADKVYGLYRVHSSCSFRPTLLPNSSFMEGRSESLLSPYQHTDVHTIRNQVNSSLHDRGKHKHLFLVVQQVQFGVVEGLRLIQGWYRPAKRKSTQTDIARGPKVK